jgi:hypothetical protein
MCHKFNPMCHKFDPMCHKFGYLAGMIRRHARSAPICTHRVKMDDTLPDYLVRDDQLRGAHSWKLNYSKYSKQLSSFVSSFGSKFRDSRRGLQKQQNSRRHLEGLSFNVEQQCHGFSFTALGISVH